MSEIVKSHYVYEFTNVYHITIEGGESFNETSALLDTLSEQEIRAMSDDEPEDYRSLYSVAYYKKNDETGEVEHDETHVFNNF